MYNSLTHRASQNFSIFFAFFVLFTGSVHAASPSEPVSYGDPWEPMNRVVFKFNDTLDRYALKPVTQGYNAITPKPVRTLISNFFSNLGEIRNTLNALLQFKGRTALSSLGRLAINSTIGMLGLVDVASPLGIEQKYQDFGLTLARWGLPSGPYVVLPLLGPKTLRGSAGLLPDMYSSPINAVQPDSSRWGVQGMDLVNTRSSLLDAESLIMGDRYTFIRNAYLQRRAYLITGKTPEDDF